MRVDNADFLFVGDAATGELQGVLTLHDLLLGESVLEEYAETSRKSMQDPAFQEVMQGYHDLVQEGRREIYMIEK